MAPTPEELAEFVAVRAKQNPGVQKIVNDAVMFDGLRDHAGWRRLYERVKADKERFMTTLARRLMGGERVTRDLEDEILFHRAFYWGAEWILAHPEEAFKNLEASAQRAWRDLLLEQLSTQEGDKPYE